MRKFVLSAALGALAGLGACSAYDEGEESYANDANATGYAEGAGGEAGNYAGGSTPHWPSGSRIVVEEGVTYRIDPSGARVRLGPSDSRIVVENGTRFRVDPGGLRVRVDDEGRAVDVDDDGVDANVNLDGNTSVQVNTD